MPKVLKLYQNIEQEGTLLYSLYKASISPIRKQDKATTGKENQRSTSLTNIDLKVLNIELEN